MGIYLDRVVPRVNDRMMNSREFAAIRARVSAGLDGKVLEIGFGSGLNVPYYPAAVVRVLAVDPAILGRKLAARRVAASQVPVEYAGLDGQVLPADSASVDHVLATWTLCTIPDVGRALSEVAEHGRSPDVRVAAWQDRLTPVQRRIAGGCHLNRPIDRLVAESGLGLTRMENYYAKGPRAFGYMFEGIAVKA